MWKWQFSLLALLTALTSDYVPWTWNKNTKKRSTQSRNISRETLLSYPIFNKPFDVHMDASNLQLGAVISQNNKLIAFYSRKLNPAQTRYTTTKKEILAIVETLKEF